ncbi:hypothetical protein MTO96_030472 [Rhipicephalus appendiculatus]
MSAPIQCLVSWKERKKIVSISGHTTEDVLAAVKATDFGDVASTGRIEVYNAQFEAYVDPPDNHVFCDGSKLRIITDEAIPLTSRYPGRLYETAAKALVVEYPVLRDTIGTGWTTSIQHEEHDEDVLKGHMEFMDKEMSRRSPDLKKLSQSMKETRSSRRSWMKDGKPTTAEILEKYPALSNAEMVSIM